MPVLFLTVYNILQVFYRMGLNDQEIVALSGAHTLGRAWKDRSGLGAEKTKFTDGNHVARGDGKPGIGKAGGQPWYVPSNPGLDTLRSLYLEYVSFIRECLQD